jgi:hypothetical protein
MEKYYIKYCVKCGKAYLKYILSAFIEVIHKLECMNSNRVNTP